LSRRAERVSELIRQELGNIFLTELNDPRIGFVTLTRVEVSPDLKTVKAYVSIMGTEAEQRTALRGLNSARKRIRGALGSRVDLRRVPEMSFHLDTGAKRSVEMSSLLAELAQERAESEPSPMDDGADCSGLREETENNGRP